MSSLATTLLANTSVSPPGHNTPASWPRHSGPVYRSPPTALHYGARTPANTTLWTLCSPSLGPLHYTLQPWDAHYRAPHYRGSTLQSWDALLLVALSHFHRPTLWPVVRSLLPLRPTNCFGLCLHNKRPGHSSAVASRPESQQAAHYSSYSSCFLTSR